MEKKWYLGIDISKEWIDVYAYHADESENVRERQFSNNMAGFGRLQGWLKGFNVNTDNAVVCMEHTGTYGFLLLWWLEKTGWFKVVESALHIKRSLGLQRGKNDQVDARRIAEYAFTFRHKLQRYQLPAKILIQLKQLLTYRDQLVRMRTSLTNSRKSHKQYEQIIDDNLVTESISKHIADYDADIKDIDTRLEQLLVEEPQIRANYTLACSVKGIGLIVAAYLIVSTQNFKSIPDGRKFACYIGLAPFENSSGLKKGKTKTSNLAYKRIKAKLLTAANSARLYNPQLKSYYQRKIKEGKEKKSVTNAVACKLINHVYAVVKRRTPYVITYQNKIAS